MTTKLTISLDRMISILIKATIVLLPLFFLPWTSEFFEFNKQYLLWLFIPLSLFLWLIKMFIENEIKFKRTPLDIPLIIFLLLTGLSSLLSLDGFSSFFGFYGRFSDAWLGLSAFILFYFILTNLSSDDGNLKIFNLIKLFLFSYLSVIGLALLAIFGILGKLTNYANIISAVSFNTVGGSSLSLVVFTVVGVIILIGVLISDNKDYLTRKERWFYWLALILSAIVLILINFYLAWYLLIMGIISLCLFFIMTRRPAKCLPAQTGGVGANEIRNISKGKILTLKIFLPSFFIVLSLLFIVFLKLNIGSIVVGQDLPKEIMLNYNDAIKIAKQVLRNNPILGSGPGTFAYDFSLYRDKNYNQSDFWQIRFDKSPSHILEMLTTGGILIMLSYFLIVSLFFYLNIVFIKKYLIQEVDLSLVSVILSAFLIIFVSQFFYPANTALQFLFWFLLALTMSWWRNFYAARSKIFKVGNSSIFQEIVISEKSNENLFKIIFLIVFLAAAGWFFLVGLEVKYWMADVFYAKSFNEESALIKAVEINPHRYNYQVSLAKHYLNQARAEAIKSQEQKNNQIIQNNIDKSINWAKQAVELRPNSVIAWETLAMIYRDIKLLTRGSELWAIRSFTRALELEPSNPVLATELGKAYLNNGELDQAREFFTRALELKNDYHEAKFGLAKVYLAEKKDKEALLILDELANVVSDPEIYYEQGRIYYNRKETDKAIDRFSQAIKISPNHVNSFYGLAISFETQGRKSEALKYFKKVLELNAGSEDIIKKIETLEK